MDREMLTMAPCPFMLSSHSMAFLSFFGCHVVSIVALRLVDCCFLLIVASHFLSLCLIVANEYTVTAIILQVVRVGC
jgi:hypothetical protein